MLYCRRGDIMPRQKSGNFDQKKYMTKYVKENVEYCRINFKKSDPDDMAVKEWLMTFKGKGNEGISNYIKRLVRADMGKQ